MTPAAGSDDTRTPLFIAFDLSSKKWSLASTYALGQQPRRKTIPSGDLDALQRELAAAKKRFGLEEDCPVISCYEAGRDGFWLHRALEGIGVENIVVDPASIEMPRRKRKPKTDSIDAGKLVNMLVRWYFGETKVWSVVEVPSEEAEDRRHLSRARDALTKDQTRLVNRIRSLLAQQGVKAPTVGGDFKEWLKQARRHDGSPLPHGFTQRVLIEYDRLCFIRSQLAAISREQRNRFKNDSAPDAEVARKLERLRGIGELSAWVLSSEVLAWRKFHNRKQVGAIAGLTGTPFDSGDSSREQGIDKAGNKRLRRVLVELAWTWIRLQPDSTITTWYRERWDTGQRVKKIGIVAVARKLLVDLWRWVEFDALPEGAVLKR